MVDGRHLEKKMKKKIESLYLSNRLTDIDDLYVV